MFYTFGMNTHHELFTSIDSVDLLAFLYKRFNLDNKDKLKDKIKDTIKNISAFEELCVELGLDKKEMFAALYPLFPNVFENKKTVNAWKKIYCKHPIKKVKSKKKKSKIVKKKSTKTAPKKKIIKKTPKKKIIKKTPKKKIIKKKNRK